MSSGGRMLISIVRRVGNRSDPRWGRNPRANRSPTAWQQQQRRVADPAKECIT